MSDEKSLKLHRITQEHSLDFVGIQEINLHLRVLGTTGNWGERNRDFQGFTHCATNLHCSSTARRIFGGTACFMTHPTAHKSIAHGQDPTDLGRWTWTSLRGRNGMISRIITGYRPTRSYDDEALTVYSQQELYFRQNGGWREPRQAFFEDLDVEIQRWLQEGDQLIIGMDVNDDIRNPESTRWKTRWNMVAPLELLHGVPNVATCQSNSTQTPIDTIWATTGIEVTNGGMTGFGTLDLGTADHRMLWVDIDQESMFGYRPPCPKRRPQDSLPLNDPRIVTKYNNFVRRERNRLHLPQFILILEQRALQGTFTMADAAQYEHALNLDLNIRKRAKQKCRHFYTGQVLFSDVIGKNRKEIHMWNMVIALRQGKRSDTRAIRRLITQTNTPLALRKSLVEAEKARETSLRTYRQNKKNHVQLHEEFRKKIAVRRAKKYGTSLEVQEKIVRNNRHQSNQFQKINRILLHKQRPSLSSVEYTDPNEPENTSLIACYSKHDIEQACAMEGQRRFSQACNTPFLQGSLLRDLGFLATQSTVDLILKGQYHPDADVDPYTQEFISHLFIPGSVLSAPLITGHTTTEEHIQGWKKMRCTIASSPFGPLFSDHIAGCDDVQIADIDAALASIPLLTGYCPKAWQKAINVMIPKKQSSTHVSKLRIIVLFHSMFNMINKSVGRLAVQRANEHNLIPAEAYGSRPGRRANICALNKVLTYDIIRQRRTTAALCSNDAVSCYDRIVHSVASICLQRLGIAAETCHMMFGTLQNLEHFVSTAYGVSDTPYGALELPLQGVGQGNGAGPAIWLIISIPLINMLRSKGFGFQSTTVLTGESYRFVCYTFVDDTDTIHSNSDPTVSHCQVISEMQEAINTWEGGLHASGGALSLGKSYWYLISMDWNHSRQRWTYKTIDSSPGSLTIPGTPRSTRLTLTRHETNHAEETLGLWIAPDSNQTAQILALQNKITKWSDKIRTRQLSSSLAWLFLTSGISMALKYPMSATNLSKKECIAITKPLLDLALPALGLPRNMPRTILFAPKEYLGYGLFDIWFQQCVDQLHVCLEFGQKKNGDITGHLLRDVAESLRLELGLPLSPFSYNYKALHRCTTPTKLHILWEFCSDNGFTLRDGLPSIALLRQHDQFLMEIFLDSKQFSSKELAILNLCRMFLQITVLSDICTGDGKSLHPDLLDRRTPYNHRTHNQWPLCGNPNASSWRMWKDAIIRWILPVNSNSLRLSKPLGAWLGPPPHWQWYFSASTDTIFQCLSARSFSTFPRTTNRHCTRHTKFHRSGIAVQFLPSDAKPTTIVGNHTSVRHTGTHLILQATSTNENNDEWSGIVIQSPDNLSHLIDGLRLGTAVAVTDGSFKDNFGTAGFILLPDILSNDDEALILANQTPGDPVDLDAYRAELGGIFGITYLTHKLCRMFLISTGTLTIGCDCLSAINNITSPYEPSPSRPHHDLISAIRYLVQSSPIHFSFRHVRGHQDDLTSYTFLDRWSQLNVDMDGLAKSYWQILNNHRPPPFHIQPFPGQWSIWHGLYRFPCWTTQRVQQVYYRSNSNTFWNKRLQCTDALRIYDWPSAALALRRTPTHQRLWIPKWLCSTLPIGKNLVRWGQPNSMLRCPRCGQEELSTHHVITCPHHEATGIRQQHLAKLEEYLDISHTEPDLKSGLLSLLEAILSNQLWTPPAATNPDASATFNEQLRVGSQHILDGFLPATWSYTQNAYYQWLGRRTTGTQWASRIIRRIWQIAWDLWMHRRRVKESIASYSLPDLHKELNQAIDLAYSSRPPLSDPSIARWFSRPASHLHSETLDWKARWLEMVSTANPNQT